MIIRIERPSTNDSDEIHTLPEWALIEMNGELCLPVDLKSASSTTKAQRPGCDAGDSEETARAASDDANDDDDADVRLELGSVRMTEKGDPLMIVGNHELRGRAETLKQPFVVLSSKRRRRPRSPTAAAKRRRTNEDEEKACDNWNGVHDSNDENDDGDDNGTVCDTSYEIRGVVSRRFVFDAYPKIIMR